MVQKKKKTKLAPLLQALKNASEEDRLSICKHLDSTGCEKVFEGVFNALHNKKVDLGFRAQLKKDLAQHKNGLRYICKSNKPTERKKRRLIQLGEGPIRCILAAVLPLLESP